VASFTRSAATLPAHRLLGRRHDAPGTARRGPDGLRRVALGWRHESRLVRCIPLSAALVGGVPPAPAARSPAIARDAGWGWPRTETWLLWSRTPDLWNSFAAGPSLRWFCGSYGFRDENILQMMLLASRFRSTVVGEDVRSVIWDDRHRRGPPAAGIRPTLVPEQRSACGFTPISGRVVDDLRPLSRRGRRTSSGLPSHGSTVSCHRGAGLGPRKEAGHASQSATSTNRNQSAISNEVFWGVHVGAGDARHLVTTTWAAEQSLNI
jgi:hypothetical protein